jgi:large subunit ribosomal protein L18
MQKKQAKRYNRHKKIRMKIMGNTSRHRLCVFRSLNHLYAQIIDDEKAKTIVSAKDSEVKKSKEDKNSKTNLAHEVGKLIAKKSLEKKINEVVFDRGGYKYHGRIKALADGAREGGLKF